MTGVGISNTWVEKLNEWWVVPNASLHDTLFIISVQAATAVSCDFSVMENHGRGTDILQELHFILNKILPLLPRLRSTLGTVTSLKTLYETLRRKQLYSESHSTQILDELRAYETHTQGHLASVTLLEKKVEETVSLVSRAQSRERVKYWLTGLS